MPSRLAVDTPVVGCWLNHLDDSEMSVNYMGLEVGGCSLFADPSGYVGRIVISNDELSGSGLRPGLG